MDKSGVIYMSIPFHLNVKIGQKKRQRVQKYCFWALTQKETKIEKFEMIIPRVFAISFKEKKNYSNWTTRSMRSGWVV